MAILHILKLAALAFVNRLFRSQTVSTTGKDTKGFNIYEYEGTPSVTPGYFIVRFRHVLNGEVRTKHRQRMTDQEWKATRERLEQSREEAGVFDTAALPALSVNSHDGH